MTDDTTPPTDDITGSSTAPEGAPASEGPDQPEQPPVRKGRWRRRLFYAALCLVLLLLVLVGLAPTIASANFAREQVISTINDRLRGNVAIEEISLSWFGDCRVDDFKVLDPAGRDVLHVDGLSFAGGLWGAISVMDSFEGIRIDSPEITLYIAEDGTISLAEAFSAMEPSEPEPEDKEPGKFSLPDGTLSIADGVVKVVRFNGQSYTVSDINSEANLASAGTIDANLTMVLQDGRKLTTEVELQDLIKQGQLKPTAASGKLRMNSDGDIDLAPIGKVALTDSEMNGKANVDIQAEFKAGEVVGSLEANFKGLQVGPADAANLQPIDLQFTGQLRASEENAAGDIRLSGEAGSTQAQFTYAAAGDGTGSVSGEDIMAALRDGSPIELPEFTLNAQGSLDLPTLAKAVPGLMNIRPGSEITQGKFEISEITVKGGKQPTLKAAVELTALTATTDGRSVRWEPITLGIDALSEAPDGLRVNSAALKSGFAEILAQGTPASLQAKVTGDLQKLCQQLDQVFEMGGLDLAGQVSANIAVSKAGEGRLDVKSDVTASGFRYKGDQGELKLGQVAFTQEGFVSLPEGAKPKISLDKANLNIDDGVQIVSSGWYDLEQEAYQADINVSRADLGFLGQLASSMSAGESASYAGSLQLHAKIDKQGSESEMRSEGNFSLQGAAVDGEPLETDVTGQWSGVALSADGQRIRVQLAKIESSLAALTADKISCEFGDELALSGDVEASADLARCMPLIARMTKAESSPDMAGQFTLKTTCSPSDGGFSLAGDGGIKDFVIKGEGDSRLEDNLRFKYDSVLTYRDHKVSVRQLELASRMLSAQVKGDIEQYNTSCTLGLRGQYDVIWDEVTKVLAQLAPGTAEKIALKGKRSGNFEATGPASQPDIKPGFRDMTASLDTGWSSAEVFGIPLGKADLAPSLKGGQLTLPQTTISAAEGRVNLRGSVDLRPESPTLSIPGKLAVLDNIQITPELGEEVLSRIVPVFGQMASAEGLINMAVQDLNLPLGEEIKKSGNGAGRLDLSKFKVQPGGLMAILLELGGLERENSHAVEVGALDFQVKDGRIHYENFSMKFPNEFDLIFSGSVGLDSTLDLVVSVPIRPELLKQLGVSGPVSEYARKLKDTRVEIPLVGTREEPRLDFSKVDTQKLLKGVLGEGLIGDLLGG